MLNSVVTEAGAEIRIEDEVVTTAGFRPPAVDVEGGPVKEASIMEVISPILLRFPRIPNLGLRTLALAPYVRSATSQATRPLTVTSV